MRHRFCWIICVFLFFLISGCIAPPAYYHGSHEPYWVQNPPDEPLYAYFVGKASGVEQDLSAVKEQAREQLIKEISKYLGLERLGDQYHKEKEAIIEEISLLVKEHKEFDSFKVEDEWINIRDHEIAVYILGRIRKSYLNSFKTKVSQLESMDNYTLYELETEAASMEKKHNYLSAANKYLEAACILSASEKQNQQQFKQNVEQALGLLTSLHLVLSQGDVKEGAIINPRKKLVFKVYYEEKGIRRPVINEQIRVSFQFAGDPEPRETQILYSDEQGEVTIRLRNQDYPYLEKVVVDYAVPPCVEQLLSTKQERFISDLRVALGKDRWILFPFQNLFTTSVPSGIFIQDVDLVGNPTGSKNTQDELVKAFAEKNLKIKVLDLSVDNPKLKDLIKEIRKKYGEEVKRVLWGTVRIEDFEETSEGFLIKVKGTLSIYDLKTNRVILSFDITKTTRGMNLTTVLSTAFIEVGKEAGQYLLSGTK